LATLKPEIPSVLQTQTPRRPLRRRRRRRLRRPVVCADNASHAHTRGPEVYANPGFHVLENMWRAAVFARARARVCVYTLFDV